jgi:hypothetical protein
MDNNAVLTDYLKSHFPGIQLESPLFYNAPIGIRFELGVPYRGIDDPAYFTNIYMRSSIIFREVFEPDEEMFVVVKSFRGVEPYICYNQGEDVFPKYIRNRKVISQVSSIETERGIEENGDLSGIGFQHSLLCKREDIDYVGILKAKAHQDFAIKPYVSDAVFFINPHRHTIFYMYDDRGIDLVAESRESLWPIYIKFNDWILKYDRERIDSIFNG